MENRGVEKIQKKREIVYLAGKISGDPQYRKKFARAAAMLEKQGYIVLNPASLPPGLDYESYMRIDAAMMAEADIICFLPDWEKSPGAQREHKWANRMEKPVLYFSDIKCLGRCAHE